MTLYEELAQIQKAHPDLTFHNNGYEELPKAIVEANREAIDRIERLMKAHDTGFKRFQNFKPRQDGTVDMRHQAIWSRDPYFIGVVYTPLEDFKTEADQTTA